MENMWSIKESNRWKKHCKVSLLSIFSIYLPLDSDDFLHPSFKKSCFSHKEPHSLTLMWRCRSDPSRSWSSISQLQQPESGQQQVCRVALAILNRWERLKGQGWRHGYTTLRQSCSFWAHTWPEKSSHRTTCMGGGGGGVLYFCFVCFCFQIIQKSWKNVEVN